MSKEINKKLWSRTVKHGSVFALFFIIVFSLIVFAFTTNILFALIDCAILPIVSFITALELSKYSVDGIRGMLLGIAIGALFASIF